MSDLPTVGVEEEFLLVDPRTGEPAPRNAEVAAEAENRSVTLQLELGKAAHDGLSWHAVDLIEGRGAVPAREQLGTLVRWVPRRWMRSVNTTAS